MPTLNNGTSHTSQDSLLVNDQFLSANYKRKIFEDISVSALPLDRTSTKFLVSKLKCSHLISFGNLVRFFVSSRLGIRNIRNFIESSYDKHWCGGLQKIEYLLGGPPRFWLKSQRGLFHGNGFANHRVFLEYIEKIIQQTGAHSVIELGSGVGINLLYLAKALPHVQFVGIELTQGGVDSAQELISRPLSPTILKWLRAGGTKNFDDLPPTNLKYVRGNATSIPYPNLSFDLAFTYLALEQMLPHHIKALKEISRVTKANCVHIEPYWEVNSWRQRIDRLLRITFLEKKSIHRLFGWTEKVFFPVFPHKIGFQSALYWGTKSTV